MMQNSKLTTEEISMFIKNWKTDVFTIPNFLSMFRLLLIPVYMTIYLNATETFEYILAGSILAVSCLTDMIDGKVARHFNMISNVGKILDPIADKATQFTMILCLSLKHPVLWFVLGLFIIKESFQGIVGIIYLRKGQMLNGALMEGKICTTVLFVSLIALVLFPDMGRTAVFVIAVINTVFLIISFVGYFRAYYGRNIKVENLD